MIELSVPGDRPVRAKALPATWPWLGRILGAWLMVMLALFLGVLSFAAVSEMTVECRREPIYLTTENGDRLTLEDGTGFLMAEEKRLQCRVGR
jgi:hypothetical protein